MVTLIEYIFDRLFEINRVFGVVESFDGNLLLNDGNEIFLEMRFLELLIIEQPKGALLTWFLY